MNTPSFDSLSAVPQEDGFSLTVPLTAVYNAHLELEAHNWYHRTGHHLSLDPMPDNTPLEGMGSLTAEPIRFYILLVHM